MGECVARGLAGNECLSGIPGLVGGSAIQNIGAYGQEAHETLRSVQVYDRKERSIRELSNAECGFGYRTSIFNTTEAGRYCILRVTFALRTDGRPTIRYRDLEEALAGRTETASLGEVRETVRAIRQRKGMLLRENDPDCRSAGSFFKNPLITSESFAQLTTIAQAQGIATVPHYPQPDGTVKIPAAWLIERVGFAKGFPRGRVGLSTKHVLAIVNQGEATAQEVIEFAKEIQAGVYSTFQIALHPEPVLVGFLPDIL